MGAALRPLIFMFASPGAVGGRVGWCERELGHTVTRATRPERGAKQRLVDQLSDGWEELSDDASARARHAVGGGAHADGAACTAEAE